MAKRQWSRRNFLQAAGAAVATFVVPHVFPASVLGANERIRLGMIGVGNQGGNNLKVFLPHVVAVCDVDKSRVEAARQKVCNANGQCAAFGDFRKLLDQKDIDAVVITTPDHWHAAMTVLACQAGKDVYCEKPLTLTVREGRRMVEAARKYNRVVQTGSQQRSDARFRLACELVRSGRIGKLQRVLAGLSGVNFKGPAVPDSAPPRELNYDLWLGPAPQRPYNAKRVHYNFRFFWDYSGGQQTNWGAHNLDIAQWGMGTDDSGPVEVHGQAKYDEMGWYEVPKFSHVTYRYANGVVVECGMDMPSGTTFEGTEGTIHVKRGRLEAKPAHLLDKALSESDVHLETSPSHSGNWLECIKTRKRPICDVEIGHRSATVCHLGNIALRTGRTIRWDPAKEEILGDAAASALLERPYRGSWKLS